ncbi:MAG: helix-turn-helix transcriptional regulator [Ruminococcaceae bacterium]|nr:helix-turn-helix transcriptional regulator [Oscillospiraceae bacterium]
MQMEFHVCACENAVDHAKDILPGRDAIDGVAEIFKLCGDATRAGILCVLCRHNLCVCELASVLEMSSSAISHQLRLLKQTGLIQSKRAGKSVVYSIADPYIKEIFKLALNYSEEREK